MKFATIRDLVKDTQLKIDILHDILQEMLKEFQTASETISNIEQLDHRTKPLEKILDLNKSLEEILNKQDYTTTRDVQKIQQENLEKIVEFSQKIPEYDIY